MQSIRHALGRHVAICVVLTFAAFGAFTPTARCGSAEDALVPAPPTPYVDHTRLMYYLDGRGVEQPVESIGDWKIRRAHILAGMQQVMGPLPDLSKTPPLDMMRETSVDGDGYVRHTISFNDERGRRLYAYLYEPKGLGLKERRPAMLALHQTHPTGKDQVDGHIAFPNLAYGRELAQRGYVVIAPDYPSFGSALQYDFENDNFASGTMKGIVNHMRCVDVLLDRPNVLPDRIGVIGHSLGGHNALFVAAFDPRIKVIVSSCGWTPFHDYYEGRIAPWSQDRYMPRIRTVFGLNPDRVPFDFYEVIAALAPRPFFSNSPLDDRNFSVDGVKKAVAAVKPVYDLYGAADALNVRYPDAKHDFPPHVRREAYQFVDRVFNHRPTHDMPASR